MRSRVSAERPSRDLDAEVRLGPGRRMERAVSRIPAQREHHSALVQGPVDFSQRPRGRVCRVEIRQFYVLGSTRLKILDWLGILMVFGGMAVPIGHITLRILTSPIREARRMNKLRKGGKR